jgi:hypothetical protein
LDASGLGSNGAPKEKAATMTAELQQQIVDLLEALQPG